MKAMNSLTILQLSKLAMAVTVAIILGTASIKAQTINTNTSLVNGESKGPNSNDEVKNLIFIPNTFTPNGDGRNDVFMIFSEDVKKISVRIYDKTGEEVFATIQMSEGWNGRHNGRELKQDLYLYRIEATYLNGDDEVIVGPINLMR